MAWITNPPGCLYLDVVYYMFVLYVGPAVCLFYTIIFRPKRCCLHKSYIETGVSCRGIIIHRQVIVRRIRLLFIPLTLGKRCQVRYAYKPPGSNTIYIKDYIDVPPEVCLQRRHFNIFVLPGQPKSGVPRFALDKKQVVYYGITPIVGSLLLVGCSFYLFSAVYAIFVLFDCVGGTCDMDEASNFLSVVTVLPLGLLGAYLYYNDLQSRVPGTVWKQIEVSTQNQCAAPSSAYPDLDREIPVAEVVAVLEQEEHMSDDANREAHAIPVSEELHDSETANNHKDGLDIPVAKPIELV